MPYISSHEEHRKVQLATGLELGNMKAELLLMKNTVATDAAKIVELFTCQSDQTDDHMKMRVDLEMLRGGLQERIDEAKKSRADLAELRALLSERMENELKTHQELAALREGLQVRHDDAKNVDASIAQLKTGWQEQVAALARLDQEYKVLRDDAVAGLTSSLASLRGQIEADAGQRTEQARAISALQESFANLSLRFDAEIKIRKDVSAKAATAAAQAMQKFQEAYSSMHLDPAGK